MSDPFLGEIRMFGGNFAPQGWAACNGALIPISQNDTLYALFGTTFGGDGQQTFGLPNLWGRVPIHDGQGQGRANYVNGATGGVESVAVQPTQHPAHTHVLKVSLDAATATTLKGNLVGVSPDMSVYYEGNPARAFGDDMVSLSPGKNLGHENRMPSLAITYIVAMAGTFPSRP
jgi:microcystin-dependent protein